MNTQQIPLFPPRSLEELVNDIEMLTAEIQELYCQDSLPWIIGYSGGKDSSCILQLIWNAIASLPENKRHKKIYIITTDTQVENPVVAHWVKNCLERIKKTAQEKNMPFEPHLIYPAVKNTFWVCLIGKGYPAPRNGFRWCTERMKIQPAENFIKENVRCYGEVILVLGTRKAESITRARSMEKHAKGRFRERLNINSRLPNSYIYTPIEDWRTDEVWLYLLQYQNPWGGDNQDLFTLYRGATADNECPLVVDTSTPSCGDSRFGCWVCTMVSKDKSMEAMIQNDEDKDWLQPLLDLRNELDIRDDKDKRDFRRIYGKVELFTRNNGEEESIQPIHGPYLKQWREYWLRKLLEAQVSVQKNAPPQFQNLELITTEELSEIRRIWLEEKHEFEDSLPRIYQEVTGKEFFDPRVGAGNNLLGSEEWQLLEELCEGDAMHLELMTKLLDIERQFFTKVRRVGIYQALEKCFETSSRSQEDAIANAKYIQEVKEAAKSGDVKTLQQKLTWGSLKFTKS
ncbi:DNA phosphorothioation system sulfurtransferase DndC [Cyanobacterium aponinum UTEX 3221]|uniref:Sulfurtransferase DndC n=2 Tax=Cyanobacterium aponinum TaxID=379064 RepID=K9Z4Q8_CYAAP|nr:DNA phosphorothioation system sulfurtransferase DndC [Cyanobacterium aponinum]AFZ54166.1 sulfurtransferase DndC [Cyanobacterium aponinum PCC 10605]MTF40478.1 DNA phosphorothioation system sulfurtransferase DndC [Cyanobacterium aponinum 0216]PHV61878.1 DNA phosphorothioation system sulfurtransferase DndC [Cyanobacterium aponinum IPPAS B-1201]WRL37518.1 DNA phosphorothioation system sulfurtransferase DndC [Cyanobacterium aponinum UTEX 3221]